MTTVERLYYLAYSLKKRHVLKDRKRLPHPVISIGNITVGGTGKTPAAIAVAEEAARRGYYPVILTRGYRGRAKGPCFVSQGSGRLLSVSDAGDEPALLAERLQGVPIVKSADRYNGGIFALEHLAPDKRQPVFILDDGFQHWRLFRDVDIALIDGIKEFGNRRLLPVGPLRGPLSELKSADIMVITKTRNEELAEELKTINTKAPVIFSEYLPAGLRDHQGRISTLDCLVNKRVYAFCGIANPDSFRQTLKGYGCDLLGTKEYRDHHAYSQHDLDHLKGRAIKLKADFIITTEKDMVKIRELRELPENLYAFQINFRADAGFFDAVFAIVERNRGREEAG
jgi:tetraacyldisaccharide 4'-kinase